MEAKDSYWDERVLPVGFTFMSLRRFCGSEKLKSICVMEIIM